MASSASGINELPANIVVRNNFKPGDIGYLTYLHGVFYAQAQGWDHTFEALVAELLAEFAKSAGDRERIWIVEKDGTVAGSIGIVEASPEQAQLRWFLLHPDLRGHGIGRILVDEALCFCRVNDYSSVFLLTERALAAAAKLYLSAGFKLTEEKTHPLWSAVLTEQRYELNLR